MSERFLLLKSVYSIIVLETEIARRSDNAVHFGTDDALYTGFNAMYLLDDLESDC